MEVFDFDQNKAVETLDVVPEKYRGLYAQSEDGGKFTLSEAVAGLVADFTGLTKSAASLRQEKKTVTDENAKRRHEVKSIADALTGLGVEIGEEGVVASIEAYINDLQEKVKGGSALKVDLEKLKSQFATQRAELEADSQKKLDAMMTTLEEHMIVGDAKAEIADQKGSPDLLLPHVRSQCVVVQNEDGRYVVRVKDPDGSGNYRLDAAGNPLGIKGLVAEMKTKEAFQRAFDSETKGGTGSTPGALQRPAAKTQQRAGADDRRPTDKIGAGLAKRMQQGMGGMRGSGVV